MSKTYKFNDERIFFSGIELKDNGEILLYGGGASRDLTLAMYKKAGISEQDGNLRNDRGDLIVTGMGVEELMGKLVAAGGIGKQVEDMIISYEKTPEPKGLDNGRLVLGPRDSTTTPGHLEYIHRGNPEQGLNYGPSSREANSLVVVAVGSRAMDAAYRTLSEEFVVYRSEGNSAAGFLTLATRDLPRAAAALEKEKLISSGTAKLLSEAAVSPEILAAGQALSDAGASTGKPTSQPPTGQKPTQVRGR